MANIKQEEAKKQLKLKELKKQTTSFSTSQRLLDRMVGEATFRTDNYSQQIVKPYNEERQLFTSKGSLGKRRNLF